MKARLGINPIGWTNDELPALGGDTPLELCLAQAKTAGFSGIELGRKFPRVSGALAPLLEAAGQDLVSGGWSTRLLERDVEAELEAMQPHLDLLEDMGCAVVIVAEGSGAVHGAREVALSRRPVLADARWSEFGRRLSQLGDATAVMGLTLVYHPQMGTVVQSSGEIDALMDETGKSVKLLLDTGHAAFAGADPVRLARRHAARIGHVHCQDVRGDVLAACLARDASFLDAVVAGVFTVPGDGAVDFPGVFAALAEYQGWLVVAAEQDPAKADPLTHATKGRAALARMLRGG